ncbi:MAG TPA: isoprenylcysteine carboxylmethyltransferase family protein [Longimicrobium sp.]
MRDSLRRSGDWLFRRRSYVPVALLPAVAAAVASTAHPTPLPRERLWEALCFFVSLLGLAIRAWTVGTAPAGTSGRNQARQIAQELNTTGSYSLCRNPLYVGNALTWAGLVLYARSGWLALAVGFSFWLVYERIVYAEEEFLRERFGDDFVAWASVTPPFLPRLGNYRAPRLPFSLRTTLRREYSGLFALVILFTAEVLEWRWFASGRLIADPVWLPAAAGSAVLYVTLRTLKRRTRVLHVDGR